MMPPIKPPNRHRSPVTRRRECHRRRQRRLPLSRRYSPQSRLSSSRHVPTPCPRCSLSGQHRHPNISTWRGDHPGKTLRRLRLWRLWRRLLRWIEWLFGRLRRRLHERRLRRLQWWLRRLQWWLRRLFGRLRGRLHVYQLWLRITRHLRIGK